MTIKNFTLSTSYILSYCPNRVCHFAENPSDIFTHRLGPAIVVLMIISWLASLCLQILGNYYNIFLFTNFIFSRLKSCRACKYSCKNGEATKMKIL